MSKRYVWWATCAVVLLGAGSAVAATGVAVHDAYSGLDHGQPYQAPAVALPLRPVQPVPVGTRALSGRLEQLSAGFAGVLGAQVIDTTSGEVVWDKQGGAPLVPASATKALTVAAATAQLDAGARLHTQIVRGANPGEVVIKSAGDVWMTLTQLDQVAQDILAVVPQVEAVFVDNSVWPGPVEAKGWDPDNVDGGFITPMEPSMVFGGRLGAAKGDVPRSHTPSFDVAKFLARRLDAPTFGVGPAPAGAEVIAEIVSPPFSQRAEAAMKHSDNVMAEAIGRELAAARGEEPSFAGATRATLAVLEERGMPTTGVILEDNSGLSTDNRIPPAVLAKVMATAATDSALRPVIGYLPVAGGKGTLDARYTELGGRGFVRAKTGTLTGVSALTGIAQGTSGHIYAFAFLVNDGDILAARGLQDNLASALHEF
ncbi:D-alanyl-D-alanine carboxypeptidase [Corynebacterium phocae]|uniref:D-alanyl-D-alanine carboxypeptidase n=1 Tax=Corynebacterium phocae TaxID=161895 RepID=A0A1L7D5D7_9CORY|nr:D-alanyl-D-alanine carboxypeptidase/D-alanyl-D-alanine-endopeptidase [Corynebacterium phocae]APT93287.1 D-alanyl-D-alanine carboxypeptidase [Corynebacterium phocae]KAA8721615.1 D-alanyl-D-alanine carboxypeptidase/D-alanyl-D-alanine-endopeptidase [Corynebacterium phocae]